MRQRNVLKAAPDGPRRGASSGFPRRRSPRRGRCSGRYGIGKLVGRSPSAAGASRPRPARLGLITDRLSCRRCLLDTGSQVSLWPPTSTTAKTILSSVSLTAANGTPITANGYQQREIQIGGKSYSFVFLIAQISRPILGLDFLQTFKMTIDLCNRQLLHSGTTTRFSYAASEISGVNVVHVPPTSSPACSKTSRR